MNESFRRNFALLKRRIKGKPLHLLDGPAGTQVPEQVIRAMSRYYRRSNANTHGVFATTRETDSLMEQTRAIIADFLGAEGGQNISFGQNMTTLAFSLSRAMGRYLQSGDEILITQLDHEANRGPWLSLRSEGMIVREVKMLDNGTLDYEDFAQKINERTRLVCMGWASNITGAINNVKLARKLTHEVGAQLLVDAVHYAPHFKIDVNQMEIDYLLCSAYKFYGPHVGILYAKTGLLDQLPIDRLRTTYQYAPYTIETGTLNHAAIAGVKAAIEFIASMGSGSTIAQQLSMAFEKISKHERILAKKLFDGLSKNDKITIIGPSFRDHRAPTISFMHKDYTATEVCQHLAHDNIFAWAGHFYALRATEILDVISKGGVVRMGISAYSENEDIKNTLASINALKT